MFAIAPADVYPSRAGRPAFRLLDVRAPVEVARGALPGALNLPILSDEERHLVGIRYREEGQAAAVALGYELTGPHLDERVARWREACAEAPTAVSCWRGGMRSRLAQEFIDRPEVPVVEGGYKALRAYLLEGAESAVGARELLVVAGMTGTGKTELLHELARGEGLQALDLEGLACHRGSAFGRFGEQPAQQSFENRLAAELLLHPGGLLLVEDESRRIGDLGLPAGLHRRMATAPLLVLEAPRHERLERIHRQYVLEPSLEHGPVPVFAELEAATRRLKRRLGGEVVERLCGVLRVALEEGSWRSHVALEPFIGPLLELYYDPLYERAMEKAPRPVEVRGDREEILGWIDRRR